jgi:acetyl-CoA synthetase
MSSPKEDREDKHAHEIPALLEPQGAAAMTLSEYRELYASSVADPGKFWAAQATELLRWFVPFEASLQGGFQHGDVSWFAGGRLNACYNAVDRHVLPRVAGGNGNGNNKSKDRSDQVALVWEGDEPGDVRRITYGELHRRVCQTANALRSVGIRRGDVVTVYMPMSAYLQRPLRFCFVFPRHGK